jgi:hypothetical protein
MGGDWEKKILDEKLDKEHGQRQSKLRCLGYFWKAANNSEQTTYQSTTSVYLRGLLGDKHHE